MYVRPGQLGRLRGGMARRAHHLSGLRRGRRLGQDDTALIDQGIISGAAVLQTALAPIPTVSYNTVTGQYTATGANATSAPGLANYMGTAGLSSVESYLPLLLIGGLAIAAVSMLKK
jgi:hypothetical protein